MILAGIYDPTSHAKPLAKEKIKNLFNNPEKTLETEYLYLAACPSTIGYEQNKIFSTHDRLLVGKLFSKDTYCPFTPDNLSALSSPEECVKGYWGNFLLIMTNKKRQSASLTKDSMGQLSLFYTQLANGAVLFASRIEYIQELMAEKPTINHGYIASFMSLGMELFHETLFENIYEVRPGCTLHMLPSGAHESLTWNPAWHINTSLTEQEQEEHIVHVLTSVIKAWTRDSDGILLSLSGGTDSSALLYCLKHVQETEQDVVSINVYNSLVRSSDERVHARAVAQHTGSQLRELDSQEFLPLEPSEQLPYKPNYPSTSLLSVKSERQHTLSNAQPYTKPCFMSGHGGDHIFLCPPPVLSLSDKVISAGLRDFGNEAREMSMMFRQPLLHLVRSTMKGLGSYYLPFKPSQAFLIDAAKRADWFDRTIFEQAQQITPHPFYSATTSQQIMPGKRLHIDLVYRGLATIKSEIKEELGYGAFYPLFTQPMVELALSIPTYKTYKNGFNRYPFRKAISDFFKTDLVWRKDKGETSGILQLGLKKYASRVFDLCLDGYCAKHKIINKNQVHAHITQVMNGHTEKQWQLIYLMTMEMYLKCWEL